jgi:putative oxidoreductase
MNPVRTLARPMLASMFVSGGIDALRNASSLAPVAEPVVRPVVDAAQPVVDAAADKAQPVVETVADKVAEAADQAAGALPDAARPVAEQAAEAARPLGSGTAAGPGFRLPDDPELLTKVNGGVMVGAGLLLAVGKLPRLSAAALAATLVPTTLAAHRFWEATDDEERQAQQIHFMKNVGLLGGLALAAIDTEGRPGVAWRARRAGRSARSAGRTARREARLARRVAGSEARRRSVEARSAVAGALPG